MWRYFSISSLSSFQFSFGYHAVTINKALTLKLANEVKYAALIVRAPLSFLPTISDRKKKWKERMFLLGLKRGQSRAETFPHHLMSESSDAVIDSLNPGRNEERNHNSNFHFKQEI